MVTEADHLSADAVFEQHDAYRTADSYIVIYKCIIYIYICMYIEREVHAAVCKHV